ncbi:hypothetical protein [Actinomadura sp. 3N407]|uniref:hypothetical protein n=1 Tax=Actinomadura sp. 3N407 TaxID=3457423 RepID=UPI003FCDC295
MRPLHRRPPAAGTILKTLGEHGVDGLILIGTGSNAAASNALLASATAVVNLIRGAAESAAPTVLAADRDGAHEATRHLLDLGHRHICGRAYRVDAQLVRRGSCEPPRDRPDAEALDG